MLLCMIDGFLENTSWNGLYGCMFVTVRPSGTDMCLEDELV